jgi:hypothetical protein
VDRVAVGIVWAVGPDLGDDALVACDRGIVRRALAELPFDLDEIGIDIASRWLARHHGLAIGATAPKWERWWLDPNGWGSGRLRLSEEPSDHGLWAWGLCGPQAARWFTDTGDARTIAVPGVSAVTDHAASMRLACLAAVSR